jgi:hypothetical protein
MAKGKQTWTETEGRRLVRVAMKSGLPVRCVRVNSQGELQVDIGPPDPNSVPEAQDLNAGEWELA